MNTNDFQFEKPLKHGSSNKATIHKSSGKLGFSASAAHVLELKEDTYFKIGTKLNEDDKNFYLFRSNAQDKESFKVRKAGSYFYINLKHVFDKYSINYKDSSVEFEVVEQEEYFILKRKK